MCCITGSLKKIVHTTWSNLRSKCWQLRIKWKQTPQKVPKLCKSFSSREGMESFLHILHSSEQHSADWLALPKCRDRKAVRSLSTVLLAGERPVVLIHPPRGLVQWREEGRAEFTEREWRAERADSAFMSTFIFCQVWQNKKGTRMRCHFSFTFEDRNSNNTDMDVWNDGSKGWGIEWPYLRTP